MLRIHERLLAGSLAGAIAQSSIYPMEVRPWGCRPSPRRVVARCQDESLSWSWCSALISENSLVKLVPSNGAHMMRALVLNILLPRMTLRVFLLLVLLWVFMAFLLVF